MAVRISRAHHKVDRTEAGDRGANLQHRAVRVRRVEHRAGNHGAEQTAANDERAKETGVVLRGRETTRGRDRGRNEMQSGRKMIRVKRTKRKRNFPPYKKDKQNVLTRDSYRIIPARPNKLFNHSRHACGVVSYA